MYQFLDRVIQFLGTKGIHFDDIYLYLNLLIHPDLNFVPYHVLLLSPRVKRLNIYGSVRGEISRQKQYARTLRNSEVRSARSGLSFISPLIMRQQRRAMRGSFNLRERARESALPPVEYRRKSEPSERSPMRTDRTNRYGGMCFRLVLDSEGRGPRGEPAFSIH